MYENTRTTSTSSVLRSSDTLMARNRNDIQQLAVKNVWWTSVSLITSTHPMFVNVYVITTTNSNIQSMLQMRISRLDKTVSKFSVADSLYLSPIHSHRRQSCLVGVGDVNYSLKSTCRYVTCICFRKERTVQQTSLHMKRAGHVVRRSCKSCVSRSESSTTHFASTI